jgi:hypothetical protein
MDDGILHVKLVSNEVYKLPQFQLCKPWTFTGAETHYESGQFPFTHTLSPWAEMIYQDI